MSQSVFLSHLNFFMLSSLPLLNKPLVSFLQKIYRQRFPAFKIMSEMGNSADSSFFWISAGLLSFKSGIILSQLLTLTSDVEVK